MEIAKKVNFTVKRMNTGMPIACRSVLFTPIKVIIQEKHLDVLLQHGFNDVVRGKEVQAPTYWHKYNLNGRFWGDITCGMDLVLLAKTSDCLL